MVRIVQHSILHLFNASVFRLHLHEVDVGERAQREYGRRVSGISASRLEPSPRLSREQVLAIDTASPTTHDGQPSWPAVHSIRPFGVRQRRFQKTLIPRLASTLLTTPLFASHTSNLPSPFASRSSRASRQVRRSSSNVPTSDAPPARLTILSVSRSRLAFSFLRTRYITAEGRNKSALANAVGHLRQC